VSLSLSSLAPVSLSLSSLDTSLSDTSLCVTSLSSVSFSQTPITPVLSSAVSLSPVSLSSASLSPVSLSQTPNTLAVTAPSVSQTSAPDSSALPVQAVGGVYPIRGDGLCGYHCAAAIGALEQDARALDEGFDCSYDVLAVTRKRILDAYDEWWSAKRVFYASDAEMEAEEVSTHVDGSSQTFRDRVNGGDKGKKDGLMAWPCDLSLYALKSDVLVVLLDAQRVSASTSSDETKVFEELWFDPVVESTKKRVVCIVVDRDHFELAVVRTPELRFVFDLGTDWDNARHLLLSFIKQRVPGVPLGPKWEPPAESAFAASLRDQESFSLSHKAFSSPLSLSSPCRNKAEYPSLSSYTSLFFPPQVNNHPGPQVEEEVKSGDSNQVTLVSMHLTNNCKEMSKSGVVEEEVGEGVEEGPTHSDTTRNTHMISNRLGATKRGI
jgi:hypothetical protein